MAKDLTLAVKVDMAPLKVLETMLAKIAYHLAQISVVIGDAAKELDAARDPADGFLLERDSA